MATEDGPRSLDSELTHVSGCNGKHCTAEVVWAFSEKRGRPMPLDRAPDPDGRLVVVAWQAAKRGGMAPVVRWLREDEVDAHAGARYTSHFATCPDRQQFRQRRGPNP